ncbi:hypothetical protein K443DRAFT_328132 [Laccaria amethystina LaAM-08-1]|uniref:Uncharacterized protein n=1 Tax=Laccaria amethystina LaAM-08-1 TaxID=1095629 RepID=A0A0C9YCD8_9AGAR|nr:hypothetical protein K443DRAFT_328132 [Laccaria amethystina LaAM-08-1]
MHHAEILRFRKRIICIYFLLMLLIFDFLLHQYGATVIIDDIPPTPELKNDGNGNTTRVLLVSALFPLTKSKHSKEGYNDWLRRFLGPITTNIYFYTTPELEETVRAARGPGLPITINTHYASPFAIPPLRGFEPLYEEMHLQDREKERHSPELYAVWNAKPWFLDHAVQRLREEKGEVYDYAFWVDAGSFRQEHRYTSWPNPAKVEQVWEEGRRLNGVKRKEDLLFFPIQTLPPASARDWMQDKGPLDVDFSKGSFFGGSPASISWWSNAYYAYHNYYLTLGLFVGKDQTLINALFLLFPDRFITVWMYDPIAPAHAGLVPVFDQGYLGSCGSEWYYYQFWLADERTRVEMRELWLGSSRWKEWTWWRERQRCRVTRVLGMKGALERRFGFGWTPPFPQVAPSARG